MIILSVLLAIHGATAQVVDVWIELGEPEYAGGEFLVPLNFHWVSDTAPYRPIRLKLDFGPTLGWLTDDGENYGKIDVRVPADCPWSVQKPLGVVSNYYFEYGLASFEGTWDKNILVLVNDSDEGEDDQNGGLFGNFLSQPLILAGLVASAIAIPVAIGGHDGDSGNGDYSEGGAGTTVDPPEQTINPTYITGIHPDDPSTILMWTSVTSTLYDVYFRTNLLDGTWGCIESNIPAVVPENVWTDQVDRGEGIYYRIGPK